MKTGRKMRIGQIVLLGISIVAFSSAQASAGGGSVKGDAPLQLKIDYSVQNGRSITSGDKIGLGDVVALNAHLIAVDATGKETSIVDYSKDVVWTVNMNFAPGSLGQTLLGGGVPFEETQPIGAGFEFSQAETSLYVGSKMTVTAVEPTSGATAKVTLNVVESSAQ